jgi:hypothetical protein
MWYKVLAASELVLVLAILISVPAAFGASNYTWGLSCSKTLQTGRNATVSWSWTLQGVTIGKGSALCKGTNVLTGSGVRPSTATGFKVTLTVTGCELFKGCPEIIIPQTDSVTPGQPFSITLSGSGYGETATFTLTS